MARELPAGWSAARLGEIVTFCYGKGLPAKSRNAGNVPVYGSNGVVGSHSHALIDGPALIVGRKGSIGEVHRSDVPLWPIDTTYYVQDFHGQPIDFWYRLLSFLPLDIDRASAVPGLNREDAYKLEVAIPPANEQRRIVAKIEALMARSARAKEALDAIPALLDRYRQSVLAAAFRGDLTADWRAQHPDECDAVDYLREIAALSEKVMRRRRGRGAYPPLDDEAEGIQFNADNLPTLPEPWAWTTLSKLISPENPLCYGVIQPGADDPGGIPLIRVCDLAEGTVDIADLRTVAPEIDAQYQRSRVATGDLLVTVVGTIGRIAIVPKEAKGANIARAIARTCINEMLPTQWVAEWLQTPFMQDWLIRGAREVARKTLNLGVLAGAPVPLAPRAEVREVLRLIQDAMRISGTFTAAVEAARSRFGDLNQSILAKAFRGELVPQDPNDEPASELLARIKAERAANGTPTRRVGRRKRAAASVE